jgi:hypothetical protein
MKYVKALGLAVLAAAAVMAFVGAGTASATVLCKNNAEPCSEPYGAGTTINSTQEGSGILETLSGELLVTCTESTVKGKVEKAGSATEPVSGPVETLSFGGCTNEVKTLATGSLEVSWSEKTNGTLTSKNGKVTVAILGVSCTYGTAATGTKLGTVTGGVTAEKQATIDINAVVPLVEGSFLCPKETRWTASYTVTEPKPLYVEKE